jgi:CRISPR-associated protein Cmr6
MTTYENLGLLYNRHYHYHDDFRDNKSAANDIIYNYKIETGDKPALGSNVSHIYFKSSYPGLIVGIGYPHETKKGDKEAILTGFFFDYTSGTPCIPGSSIKGVVRSVARNQSFCCEYLLPDALKKKITEYSQEQYSDFIEALFGVDPSRHNAYETDDTSIYNRIIFMDSYAVDHLSVNAKNKVFSLDYLAPHKNSEKKSSLLSNPDLVKLLKVVPEVIFDFSFIIPEEIVINELVLKREDIIFLVKKAIEEAGVGAKTNLGYGYLTPINYEPKQRQASRTVLSKTQALISQQQKDNQAYQQSIKDLSFYKVGTKGATVLEISDGYVYVRINENDDILVKKESTVRNKFENVLGNTAYIGRTTYPLEKGAQVVIKINREFDISNKNFSILPAIKN